MEWPGSGSTYSAPSPKRMALEDGSAASRWLISSPVTPSISGFSGFIHPSMWSNDRFSITTTTTVFILPPPPPPHLDFLRAARARPEGYCGLAEPNGPTRARGGGPLGARGREGAVRWTKFTSRGPTWGPHDGGLVHGEGAHAGAALGFRRGSGARRGARRTRR